ncbi:MAG: hypothetical protein LBT59_04105 [Clostridiales bacterium]|nr:hypothetical protein [Clostridiales bacterium]
MKKYLASINLPAAGKHFDAFLPCGKTIGEVTVLLARLAEQLYGESFKSTPDTVLLNAASGLPYKREITIQDAGIRNASKLTLV